MEDRPLAKRVEEGEGTEKPETVRKSLQECSQSHSDYRLQKGFIFKLEKGKVYYNEHGRAPAIEVSEDGDED